MIIEKIKKVLTKPNEFFAEVKSEVGIGSAFKYLAVVSIFYAFLMMLYMFVFSFFLGFSLGLLGPSSRVFPFSLFSGFFTFVIPIAIYVLSLIGPFIGAGIMHLFVKLFGGKGDYSATYKTTVYSSTPTLLFGWIPYINILVSIYSLYLYLKGLSILHEVSMGRALLIVLVPIIVIAIVVFALIFVFIFGMFSRMNYVPYTETTETVITSGCKNHADCSQECSTMCSDGIYGCCVNGNIGQCNINTGTCYCYVSADFCTSCPSCDYSYQYCDGFTNTCKTKSGMISTKGLTGYGWLIISKLPFYPKT